MTASTCEYEFSAEGPHPGCGEFAAPDVFACGQPATWFAVVHDAVDNADEVWELCDPHHAELIRDLDDDLAKEHGLSLFFDVQLVVEEELAPPAPVVTPPTALLIPPIRTEKKDDPS